MPPPLKTSYPIAIYLNHNEIQNFSKTIRKIPSKRALRKLEVSLHPRGAESLQKICQLFHFSGKSYLKIPLWLILLDAKIIFLYIFNVNTFLKSVSTS